MSPDAARAECTWDGLFALSDSWSSPRLSKGSLPIYSIVRLHLHYLPEREGEIREEGEVKLVRVRNGENEDRERGKEEGELDRGRVRKDFAANRERVWHINSVRE